MSYGLNFDHYIGMHAKPYVASLAFKPIIIATGNIDLTLLQKKVCLGH